MLEKEEPHILKKFGFPNTYTLTKNLAEQALLKNKRPDLRISISRPAGISACQKFPFPGWTDSIAAGGALIYCMGMGISNRDLVYPDVISTFIPCDHVVNGILVVTAVSAARPETDLTVFNICASGAQPKYT